jgi:protein SCO1/2
MLLAGLLQEDDPLYEQRGGAAVVRMRGWALLAYEDLGLPENALIFALEELDNGRDAYLVAAAARVLRSNPVADAAMAPYLVHAILNVREHDDLMCLAEYGRHSATGPATTAVREILASLRWLGPRARGVLPELEAMRSRRIDDLERTIEQIRSGGAAPGEGSDCCNFLKDLGGFRFWPEARSARRAIRSVMFEDQNCQPVSFREFFCGQPSVVVFFYSRCENPRKCSLTIAKLARVQEMLAERGLEGRIRTAAITYDPHFDLPARLFAYGKGRGVRMDAGHRMLRSTAGMKPLRAHFHLGVNFIESLVNRHKIEAFVLNEAGEVAGSFERIRWDEGKVVDQAVKLLDAPAPKPAAAREMLGIALPVAAAILPKCPMCWAAYLSAFGIAGLRWAPYFRWLVPLLVALMAIQLGSLWLRGMRRGKMLGFYLGASGTFSIVALGMWQGIPLAGAAGVLLSLAGALVNTVMFRR